MPAKARLGSHLDGSAGCVASVSPLPKGGISGLCPVVTDRVPWNRCSAVPSGTLPPPSHLTVTRTRKRRREGTGPRERLGGPLASPGSSVARGRQPAGISLVCAGSLMPFGRARSQLPRPQPLLQTLARGVGASRPPFHLFPSACHTCNYTLPGGFPYVLLASSPPPEAPCRAISAVLLTPRALSSVSPTHPVVRAPAGFSLPVALCRLSGSQRGQPQLPSLFLVLQRLLPSVALMSTILKAIAVCIGIFLRCLWCLCRGGGQIWPRCCVLLESRGPECKFLMTHLLTETTAAPLIKQNGAWVVLHCSLVATFIIFTGVRSG